ncbi:cation:dicarboxylate symporter family transporter [Novosphingobium sp. MMS21-SN21R]|uniref:dicarboxylate/amino acid:cation symporter n=1 Tax=Novosphingobium sp. MMS21-SN21R TaxID=2969298 RepID=UPI002886ABC4|nr:cation:dicarboxylase symporter family transporter [Novosphingobium sp. MMS21-SN21R]MDT0509294.1 cation:dicarboxylase symporter family transporter [Novosphingobium sp. MMS21-SN21R]
MTLPTPENSSDSKSNVALPPIAQVPAMWTFIGLVGGLLGGLAVAFLAPQALPLVETWVKPVGEMWLRALQATIVPLVAALLFTGVTQTVAMASAGAMARRSLGMFLGVLSFSALTAILVTPVLLKLLPIPAEAGAALRTSLAAAEAGPVPGVAEFLRSIVPTNVIDAAANDRMLPMILFVAVFALAVGRLAGAQREVMTTFFAALASAMLVMIGWVLALAPIGVFALSMAVAASSGTAAIGALAHYVLILLLTGSVVLVAGYVFAVAIARQPLGAFVRAMLPVQTIALSTQSSLASLPAMLGACGRLGVRETTSEFVMPLAVALFRATSPVMNLAVAIYVANLYGVPLSPMLMVSAWIVAILVSLSSVSLPGSISFVASVGPIAIAMNTPIAPLALLVAVEVLPDLLRTVGNVTFDVAVTAAVDRRTR